MTYQKTNNVWEYRGIIALTALLITIFIVFFSLGRPVEVKEAGTEPLSAAFLAFGAEVEEIRMVSWSLYGEYFMEIEEMKSIAAAILEQLPLSGLTEHTEKEKIWHSYSVKGKRDSANYQLLFQSLPDEAYVLLSCVYTGGAEDFPRLKDQVTELCSVKSRAEINCLLIGSVSGMLSREETEERARAAFTAAEAKTVAQTEEYNYYSLTGYVGSLRDFVTVGKQKANIQIACNYNEQTDKTYVYVGHPLVFDDY